MSADGLYQFPNALCLPECRHSMVLGSKGETPGTIYRRSDTSFTGAPVTQRRSSQNKEQLLTFGSSPPPPHRPDCVRWPKLFGHFWTLQNQDVSDADLRRGTKCIEADVKALHLESCSAAGHCWAHGSAACVNTWGLCRRHFHPHSIHCPSNEPINLGLASTPQ